MASKKSPQPENYHDQKSEAPKSGFSGLEPVVDFATQGALDYDHDAMLNSQTRSGLQPKGAKNGGEPTTDSQLGGGRSIVGELKDRNKL
jgi:hypothetical protein